MQAKEAIELRPSLETHPYLPLRKPEATFVFVDLHYQITNNRSSYGTGMASSAPYFRLVSRTLLATSDAYLVVKQASKQSFVSTDGVPQYTTSRQVNRMEMWKRYCTEYDSEGT